ncbi:hypothetical protein COY28_01540 [Candidatus Woesearchaeota archaeon CG_4_10_14_0_2_um_filter_57_5]|nr:MAG: hypothetical protein COV94_00460 [Candidatus Woesearchaeota archaeon CG11_big_fil_rev_8_21_14_0_20_57_5]PIZ55773.1 MAG: hypothetical protein COY28_01540 [Candidatus Woesearchaeota archaeon CG_4_10_14_0_2_um_filter_57_5]
MDYHLRIALLGMRQRKLRSWLTVLGIIVGAAAVVSLFAVSQGMQYAIEDAFEQFGTNRIFVMPKGFQGPGAGVSEGLTIKDVEVLERMSDWKYVTPYYILSGTVDYGKETKSLMLYGMPTKDMVKRFEDFDIKMAQGRPIADGSTKEINVGSLIGDGVFSDPVKVRSKLDINGNSYTVAGVFESVGNEQDDSAIYIDIEEARALGGAPKGVTFIDLRVKDGVDVDRAADAAHKALKRARNNENFDVMTPEQITGQINMALGIIRIVLVGIASISLLVGGIGIANSMFTSVLERTRDIGVMKSIGARRRDIFVIFLIESTLVGTVGGVIGTSLGIGMAKLVELGAKGSSVPLLIKVTPGLLLLGILFSAFAGALSGIVPSLQAARMTPVEALRK